MKKGLIYALIIFILDQLSKAAVLVYFSSDPTPVQVTPFFNLVLAWNKGVSFSMMHSDHPAMRWVLVAMALAICTLIIYWMRKETDPKTVNSFGIILGGAIGNIFDRIQYGAVIDFLDFHIGTYHWPAFNVADTAVCIGAAIILIWGVFLAPSEHSSEKKEHA